MPFNDYETSDSSSRPIELYEFIGTYNSYFMTSYSEQITSNGQVYIPEAISRGKVQVATQDRSENAIEITIPFNNPMVMEYAYKNTPPNLDVIIRRAHEYDHNDTVIMWNGKVTNFTIEGKKAKLRTPALFSFMLQGNAPNPRYQAPCNHILYDLRCGIDPALHQHNTTVVSVNGVDIVVTDIPFPDGHLNAGVIFSSVGEQRMISSSVGTSLKISFAFSRLNVGDTVTLRKGCDHAFNGDCKNKFNNGARFGGFPIVPKKNPFTDRL